MPKTSNRAAMRRDWDERARKDAFYYVATWRKDWTLETFLDSGEEEYRKLVQPVLDEFQFSPERVAMLEVGCGAGRMTASFARRFATVYAFDISEEMQNLAKQNLTGFRNIHWVLGDGTDLSAVGSDSVELVFCCLVLQHVPSKDLILTYVREMLRVLQPGGVFLFQFNSRKLPTMNWKGRLAWGAVDNLWALNLKKLSQTTAQLLGFDPAIAGKSWRGASLPVGKVVETVRAAGASEVEIRDEGTPMTWCRGRKSVGGQRLVAGAGTHMNQARWIAILGRGSLPTDGIEDYCVCLREALRKKDMSLELLRVPWAEQGWFRALRWLRKRLAQENASVALIQYTALEWSRWGFPAGVLLLLWTLKRCDLRVVVVFHDALPYTGTRWRDWIRRGMQIWVMRWLVRSSSRSVSALPADRLTWLPTGSLKNKFSLIPIGSNVTEAGGRDALSARKDGPGIAVFGIGWMDEAAQIGRIVSAAARNTGPVRLVLCGHGTHEAEAALRKNLDGAPVTLEVHGIRDAAEVCKRLQDCTVQLFVRSGVSACRGSLVAGICCGLPVVGWEDCDTAYPITEAGLRTVPSGDETALIRALGSVLTDEASRLQLSLKSTEAARKYFSWDRIAARFATELCASETASSGETNQRQGRPVPRSAE